jgi:hypothetical protein
LHRQASAADCAVDAWLKSARQGVHAAEPFAALYVEAGHAVQAPLAPVYPASQRHDAMVVWAVSECPEFAGQALHASEPLEVLYCDATHAAHAPPSAPEYPRWHRHAAARVWACPELAGQAVQAAEPLFSLNAPAGHALHGPPLGPV